MSVRLHGVFVVGNILLVAVDDIVFVAVHNVVFVIHHNVRVHRVHNIADDVLSLTGRRVPRPFSVWLG